MNQITEQNIHKKNKLKAILNTYFVNTEITVFVYAEVYNIWYYYKSFASEKEAIQAIREDPNYHKNLEMVQLQDDFKLKAKSLFKEYPEEFIWFTDGKYTRTKNQINGTQISILHSHQIICSQQILILKLS